MTVNDKHQFIQVFGIVNCDTVKKARSWLDSQAIAYVFHDFKKSPPTAKEVQDWLQRLGWKQLVNTRGRSWQMLDDAQKRNVVDEASALPLVLQNASLIKRPLVQWQDGQITVGFDAPSWSARVQSQGSI